ncbi:MAG: hypothetical protein JNJ54_31570 [Myxococcaceae bacterium]|nr:hypothetical protein [Myxococcaceae bacterium]
MTDDVRETHSLDEFDTGTLLLVMADGSLQVQFRLMPPSWTADEAAFEDFDEQLSEALDVEVEALDKELFSIAAPRPDTLTRLRDVLLARRAATS